MRTIQELETLFRKIGVADPKAWAADEFEYKNGNLATLAFLRELWRLVPAKVDVNWLRRWVAYEAETQPEACAAYSRLLGAGAGEEDLLALLRGVLSEMVQQTVAVLDDGRPNLEDDVADQIQWRLCALNEEHKWVPLNGLHEFTDGDEIEELKP